MKNEDFIQYYKINHERKVFHTRLLSCKDNAYIMYIYDYANEFENFSSSFLYYLPYYVRNSDQLISICNDTIDQDLINRSKKIRFNEKIIPQRDAKVAGIYGELFLDFYLRIVCKRRCLISYAMKKSFSSAINEEFHGPDNVVYYIENNIINICFCEAKFVGGAATAKSKLIEDINGDSTGKNSHLSKEYLNDYIAFMIGNNLYIDEKDKEQFSEFINNLNLELDNSNDFVSVLIDFNVCCNFIFFAIFDSKLKEPDKLIEYYKNIYDEAKKKIDELGIKNFKIEIIFIPTESKPLLIKKEIDKKYE